MSDRRRVLELFEIQKDTYEQRVNDGIEKFRKANAKISFINKDGKALKKEIMLSKKSDNKFNIIL